MNITSYNITDVGYHYIGLRVVAAMPDASRESQFAAVSKNVAKYSVERALRLLLPEPRSDFTSVGEKVLQELKHLNLARPVRGEGYQLTEFGTLALETLNAKNFPSLRRLMTKAHLETYDNLRDVVLHYIRRGPLMYPIVETARGRDRSYLTALLRPTFGERSEEILESLASEIGAASPKKVEDAMRAAILSHRLPDTKLSVPLFRAMGDRLVSLRLVNVMRMQLSGCEFEKSYSPCVENSPRNWHRELLVTPEEVPPVRLYLSEPDMTDSVMQQKLLDAVNQSFTALCDAAGYYDLPDVRDFVCDKLMIPEAAFDEGINELLDRRPSPLTVGLQYEHISGRRKPLVRTRESTQIYNLIRRP